MAAGKAAGKPPGGRNVRPVKRRDCYFSKNKIEYVDYKDVALLRKFISDRGKIKSNRVTGTTPQYQKLVAEAVKNAREMALLPYTTR
jgi:small subunit ribosomal protein S18